MSFLSRSVFQLTGKRTITTFSSFSPLRTLIPSRNELMTQPASANTTTVATASARTGGIMAMASPFLNFSMFGFGMQRRWKARGNTYQPSTLKRKRRIGFLARARSRQGNKILERRKAKGRWYLTH